MNEYQSEMRTAFLGGFAGQLVSRADLVGSGRGQHRNERSGGDGSPVFWEHADLSVDPDRTCQQKVDRHGEGNLYRESWFFPAALIVVGSHYLPFVTLYRMKMFAVLAGLMVAAGAGIGLYGPDQFSLGGWAGAGLLIAFAFIGRTISLRKEQTGVR